MSDSTEVHPLEFKVYHSGGVRACEIQTSNGPGCQSVKFSSYGVNYTQACGRVVGEIYVRYFNMRYMLKEYKL